MASLAEIRARIAAQENKSSNKGSNTQSDNSVYPHWNMDEGTTATIPSTHATYCTKRVKNKKTCNKQQPVTP